jgi:predicted amidohydrolase
MVVSPWGEIIAEADAGEDVVVAELDFERLEEIRADMPVLEQRKLFL